MPRKPANKTNIIDEEKKNTVKSKESSKSTKKSTSTTKKVSKVVKDSTIDNSKAKVTKKATTTTKKSNSSKSPATKKTSTAKATTKATKTTKKSGTTKSSTTSKNTSTTKKSKVSKKEITSSTDLTKKIEVLEYYDLPYRYNQTIVKVLAQTPTSLFIYWDISDVDRANFIDQYGEDFFNNTKPVLIIHNDTMHYSFEIEIDDFANSWYLHVNDSNCEYFVELGRRPKYYNNEKHANIPNNYLHITSSNVIDAPNNHVLFDKDLKTVYFRDVKTNIVTAKDITSISFLRNMGRIYNLYDLQSDFTKNSWVNSNHWQLDLTNPSSSNPSSTFK